VPSRTREMQPIVPDLPLPEPPRSREMLWKMAAP
jgi:hypothetical protein